MRYQAFYTTLLNCSQDSLTMVRYPAILKYINDTCEITRHRRQIKGFNGLHCYLKSSDYEVLQERGIYQKQSNSGCFVNNAQ